MIVLTGGGKVLLTAYERAVTENDLVKVAVVSGEGRFYLGIMIETSKTTSTMKEDDLTSRS